MLPRGCVDDQCSILTSTLDLPDTVTKALEALPDLRGTQVDVEVLAFDVSHEDSFRDVLISVSFAFRDRALIANSRFNAELLFGCSS